MKSVEKAISEYTDSLINNSPLPIESFAHEMSSNDYAEFNQLIHFIDLLFQNKQQDKNKALFYELNKYKIELYDQSKTVNFRTEKGNAPKEALDKMQKLFDEEFPDD